MSCNTLQIETVLSQTLSILLQDYLPYEEDQPAETANFHESAALPIDSSIVPHRRASTAQSFRPFQNNTAMADRDRIEEQPKGVNSTKASHTGVAYCASNFQVQERDDGTFGQIMNNV